MVCAGVVITVSQLDYKLVGIFKKCESRPSKFVDQICVPKHFTLLNICVPKAPDELLRHLLSKDVPKELIIPSNSIHLLDAVGQGTLTTVTL